MRLVIAGLACLLPALPAAAQAWLPRKGEFSLGLNYVDLLNKHHYSTNGDEVDVGHTDTNTLGLWLSWSPSDRLLLYAGIPYVRTRFRGEGHHGPEVDHGHPNTTFTDLRLELHYQWLEAPVAVAPFVAIVQPVVDYPVLGHAAPGRGLGEKWVGFFAGKSLDEWLPRTYVQFRYSYAFVQKAVDIAHDRSNADLEVGYFATPEWLVQLILSRQWAHGGVDVPMPPSNPLYPHHDQLAAAEFMNGTAGLVWFASSRTSLALSYSQSLWGKNAHKVDHSLSFGVGYRVEPR